MKQSKEQRNNRNTWNDQMAAIEQQINQNVRNDERTGKITTAKEEEQKKQHAAWQKESRKRKLDELKAQERE